MSSSPSKRMSAEVPATTLRPDPLSAVVDLLILMSFGALLLGSGVSDAVAGGLAERLILPGRILLLCLMATLLLRRRGETWRSLGLAPPASPGRVAILVAGGYLAMGAMAFVLTTLVLPALKIPPLGAVSTLAAVKGDPWEYAYWLAIAWTSAAIGEEVLFRGFLWSRMERALGGARWAPVAAMVIQAAIFGLGHSYQGLGGVLLTGTTGLILGGVYLAGRRNLAACILLHGLIDTVSLTAIFLGAAPGA